MDVAVNGRNSLPLFGCSLHDVSDDPNVPSYEVDITYTRGIGAQYATTLSCVVSHDV